MNRQGTFLYQFGKSFAVPIFRMLFPVWENNPERVPEDGPLILCSNHVCMKDPIYLALSPKRQIFYMAKKELFENKFVSGIFHSLGTFAIERGAGDTNLTVADEILKKGGALGIFIEGTRSKDGKLGRPKSGAVMLAYKNQAPILPVCITTPNGGSPKQFERAILSFGELIQPEELGIKEGTGTEFRQASRMVMERIAEMRARDEKMFPLPKRQPKAKR